MFWDGNVLPVCAFRLHEVIFRFAPALGMVFGYVGLRLLGAPFWVYACSFVAEALCKSSAVRSPASPSGQPVMSCRI